MCTAKSPEALVFCTCLWISSRAASSSQEVFKSGVLPVFFAFYLVFVFDKLCLTSLNLKVVSWPPVFIKQHIAQVQWQKQLQVACFLGGGTVLRSQHWMTPNKESKEMCEVTQKVIWKFKRKPTESSKFTYYLAECQLSFSFEYSSGGRWVRWLVAICMLQRGISEEIYIYIYYIYIIYIYGFIRKCHL